MNRNELYETYIEETFENLTELGTGETGRTFLAKHKGTGEIVVKKQIPLQTGQVYEKMKAMNHPNFARIYEVCYCQGYCIVIEEYISGETLEEKLENLKILPEELVTEYLIQILKGLEAVHGEGIVHRDLTPANILISTDNVPKLIDFGIARNPKENQTKDTLILGTLGYASPEQFGFRQTDSRTDVYAIGILINKMLTGKLPNEHLTENRRYRKIIEKCIQIDPDKRYHSAGQILEELEEKKQSWEEDSTIWPGFRSNILWRKIVAIAGYICMLLAMVIFLGEYGKSIQTFCLEFIALFLYVWVPFIIGTNMWRWDRRWFPFSTMPKALTISIRVIAAIVFFSAGIELENYVKFTLLGLTIQP